MNNIFFKKLNKISLEKICKELKIKNILKKKVYLNDIKTLDNALKDDITFLHSSKYLDILPKINSNFIITSPRYIKYFSNKNLLVVDNVLIASKNKTFTLIR